MAKCLYLPVIALLFAQPKPENAIRITVNLVQVDAVVTDSKGRHVTGLHPNDFEILEDGKPRHIANFTYVETQPVSTTASRANEVPAATAPIRREQVRRTIALVVDDLGLSYDSMNEVKRGLRKYLDDQIQPGDLVAIVRTSGGVSSLQQFTSDRRILGAAVDRLRWFLGRSGSGPLEPLDSDLLVDPDHGREGRSKDAARIENEHMRAEMLTLGTIGALRSILVGLQDLPGRKSVILFSDGFKVWLQEQGIRRLDESVQKLIDQANRSSVVLYAIDARGVQSLAASAADEVNAKELEDRMDRRSTSFVFAQQGLAYLARETGGFAITNRNDVGWGIGHVLEDQSGYYLIGYKPDDDTFRLGKDGPKYHRITVKLKKRDLQVRSRAGFYGVPSQEGPSSPAPGDEFAAALRSPFGAAGIRLRMTSLFTDQPEHGGVVRNLLHLDARDLQFSADGGDRLAHVEIPAAAHGEMGEPIAQKSAASELRVSEAEFQSTLDSGLLYEFDLPVVRPGAYQLRVAVRDGATGKVGSASQFIETPDIERKGLALSGVFLGAESPGGTEDKTGVIRHAALRTFQPGQTLSFSFQIYNATAPTELEARLLLWRDGKPIFKGEPAPLKPADTSDPKRLLSTGSLKLGAKIPAGPYVLQLVVTDKTKRRASVTQWIDFDIL